MNIEEFKELCLSFPHTTEDIKWGKDLCFLVGGKMFAAAGLDEPKGKFSFKCTPEKFAELTERDGIIPAPYVARFHWVAIEDPTVLSDEEYEDLVSRSYLLVFENLPVKERRKLGKQ